MEKSSEEIVKVNEPAQVEDSTMSVGDPVQQETWVEQPQTVQQQVISVTEEASQNVGPSLFEFNSKYLQYYEENKIENLENTLSEINKIEIIEEIKSENDIADASSTLAAAALNQPLLTNETTDIDTKPIQPLVQVEQEEPLWYDVGVIKGPTYLVKQFYSTSITDEHETTSLDNLPDYINKLKIDLQPGTAYNLRIAAINACGRGEWSEISTFRTGFHGYPEAPNGVHIKRSTEGLLITWEAPPSPSKILEYSVCVAIEDPQETPPHSPTPTTIKFKFVRLYSGPHNAAVISYESLGAAFIDRTLTPAILFRIAAKNEKGYGSAIQVRWLQEYQSSYKNPSMKREKSVNLLTNVSKRLKL